MKIGLFTYVHLDESELLDFNLLDHYIRYYIKQGVLPIDINILPYGYDKFKYNYDLYKSICAYYDVPIYSIENYHYDFVYAHNKFLDWQKTIGIKYDWLIKTDLDEFMSYGCYTLVEYVYFLSKNKYDWAAGHLIDCIDVNHKLKPVDKSTDIFLQFPKKMLLTQKIIKGCSHKVVAFKSKCTVNIGHHYCIDQNVLVHYKTSNMVNHFKWLSNMSDRIIMNKTRKMYENHTWAIGEIDRTQSIISQGKLIL